METCRQGEQVEVDGNFEPKNMVEEIDDLQPLIPHLWRESTQVSENMRNVFPPLVLFKFRFVTVH